MDRDALTQQLENDRFENGSGLPTDANPPFNRDPDGLRLNFGYGINITGAFIKASVGLDPSTITNTIYNNKILGILYQVIVGPIPANPNDQISNATITLIQNYLDSESHLNAAIAPSSTLQSSLNSSLASQDWRPAAASAMDLYYTNVAISHLEQEFSNFDNLKSSAKIALEEVEYNTGGKFVGSKIQNYLSAVNNDYAGAAYELAFGTATPNDTAYEERTMVSAAQMLGFEVDIAGNNLISKITATAEVNLDTVKAFLIKAAEDPSGYNPSSFANITPGITSSGGTAVGAAFYNKVADYLIQQGIYVVQPGETSFTKVFSDIKAIDSSVKFTAQDIQILNNGTSFTPGTVLQVRAATEADFGNIEPSEGPNPSAGWTVLQGTPTPGVRPDGSIEVFYTADTSWQPNPVLIGADTVTTQVFNPATGMLDNVTGPAYNVLSVVYNGQSVNDLSGGFFINVQQVIGGNVTFGADQLDEFKEDGTQLSLSTLILKGSDIVYSLDGLNLLMDSGFGFAAVASTENDATGVTLIGNDTDNEQLYSANTKGGNTLIAGDGTGDNLTVGVGSNTLIGGDGGDTFTVYGAGFPGDPVNVDVITGGSGNDTFNILGNMASGSAMTGGGGSDTLIAAGNLSLASISGIGTLSNSHVTLTAAQLDGFNTLNFSTVYASAANTTYSLAGKTALYSGLDTNGFDNVTLVGADSGVDTLTATGNNDILIGGAGDDFFDVSFAGAGATITGNGGNDTLWAGADISQMSIAGDIGTLEIDYDGSVKLTAAQLANFTTIEGPSVFDPMTGTYSNGPGVLFVDGGATGTISLAGKTLVGDIVLDTTLTTGDVTLVAADTGSTLRAGSGNDTLTGGAGDDTLVAGSGNDTLAGGNGNNSYAFTDPDSTSTYLINAFHTDDGQSVVQLAAGVTPGEVTVAQVGNDLKLDWANDPIIIQNYFLGDQYKVASVNFADGTVWSAAHLEELVATANYTTIDLGGRSYATATAGSTGNYKLLAGDGTNDTLNASHASGNNILVMGNGGYNTLNADFSSGNVTLTVGDGTNDMLSANSSGGNNLLTAGNGGYVTLRVDSSTGSNILVAGYGVDDILSANGSHGNNRLTAGNGGYAILRANSSTGDNILVAGDGVDDKLSVNNSSGNNQLTAGNGGYAALHADASSGSNTLTAGDGVDDLITANNSHGTNYLAAGNGDYATLQAKSSSGNNTLVAGSGNNNVLTVAGSTGHNSLTSGNGMYNSLIGGSGDDILTIGSGSNNTLKGGGGNDVYSFGSGFGAYDTINNADPAGSIVPHGEIDFGAGISDENLWFMRQGNNLVIDELGTNGQITVSGWFNNAGSQVESIHAGGLELDNSQVSQLIQAMASFSAHNAGFSASQAIAMPTDSTLQAAITASWHS